MVKNQQAYYLLQGDIVKVVREDAASGLIDPGCRNSQGPWTLTKYLSKRPIENAFGVIETPETSGLILAGITRIPGSVEPSGAAPARSASSTPN